MGDRDRPNVLFVVLDTARADHFGPFHGKAYTPAFDALAERGSAAVGITTSPWTVPSHASMFSGLLPFDHGVTGAAAITPDRRLASLRPAIERLRERWLPSLMAHAGYRTVGVSANVWITPEMGFDLGFEEFHPVGMARVTPRGAEPDHHWKASDLLPEGLRRRAKRGARYLRDARKGRDFGSRQALEQVRQLAAEPGDRPWFLFVNVMEAHAPYLPPPGFGELAPRDRFKGVGLNHRYLGDVFVTAFNVGAVDEVVKEEFRLLRALYRAEIEYVDAFLAGAFEALAPHLDRTLVVVTADHGENLGEDHRLGHVAALDERLVRAPLAVAGPDAPAVRDGQSLSTVSALVADAAGIAGHPYARDEGGVAVAQYESAWHHLRRASEVERRYELNAEQAALLRAPMSLATDGRSWLVRTGAADRAWSSSSDGDDANGTRLHAALDALPAAPPEAEPAGATPDEEAEIEARLRELGYL